MKRSVLRRTAVRRYALLIPLLLAGGCAHVMHSYDLAPNGLTKSENRWRTMLAAGHGDSVSLRIARGGSDAPSDELLRLLYLGTSAHYGGDYLKSGQYLEAAAALSDDRITKSLSRSMLSLISNDGVLPYTPARSERMLIPYYAALNYIALGQMEDAAVEARRLSALLEAESSNNDTADLSDDARTVRATLRSFTGAIFEATGHRNDALVAYRNAAMLGARVDTSALSALGFPADSGVVVVMLEDGFVAHRVEQNLFVWLGPDEMNAFSTGGASNERAETAAGVAARVTNAFPHDRREWGRRRGDVTINLPPDLQHSRRHVAECDARSVADASGAGSGTGTGTGTGTIETNRGDESHTPDTGRSTGDRTALGNGNAATEAAKPSGHGIGDVVKRAAGKPATSPSIAKSGKTGTAAKDTADASATVSKPDATASKPSVATPPRTRAPRAEPRPTSHTAPRGCRDEDDVPYLLKVAWPVYTDARTPAHASFVLGADTIATRFADLSGAVVSDYSGQIPLIVARTVARGAAKAVLTQSVKKKASEKNEGLGKLIGLLGNAGNVMLERADTRSWHLLPAGVALVRMRAPVGAQKLSVDVNGRMVDLGTVNIEAGKIAFISKRAW